MTEQSVTLLGEVVLDCDSHQLTKFEETDERFHVIASQSDVCADPHTAFRMCADPLTAFRKGFWVTAKAQRLLEAGTVVGSHTDSSEAVPQGGMANLNSNAAPQLSLALQVEQGVSSQSMSGVRMRNIGKEKKKILASCANKCP